MFAAEKFYLKVANIIKEGDSYIYRTSSCRFRNPFGTQAVVIYGSNCDRAIVMHSLKVSTLSKFVFINVMQ